MISYQGIYMDSYYVEFRVMPWLSLLHALGVAGDVRLAMPLTT